MQSRTAMNLGSLRREATFYLGSCLTTSCILNIGPQRRAFSDFLIAGDIDWEVPTMKVGITGNADLVVWPPNGESFTRSTGICFSTPLQIMRHSMFEASSLSRIHLSGSPSLKQGRSAGTSYSTCATRHLSVMHRIGRSPSFGRSNQTVQRIGASRFAQAQIQRHRRLAPIADLFVRPLPAP